MSWEEHVWRSLDHERCPFLFSWLQKATLGQHILMFPICVPGGGGVLGRDLCFNSEGSCSGLNSPCKCFLGVCVEILVQRFMGHFLSFLLLEHFEERDNVDSLPLFLLLYFLPPQLLLRLLVQPQQLSSSLSPPLTSAEAQKHGGGQTSLISQVVFTVNWTRFLISFTNIFKRQFPSYCRSDHFPTEDNSK